MRVEAVRICLNSLCPQYISPHSIFIFRIPRMRFAISTSVVMLVVTVSIVWAQMIFPDQVQSASNQTFRKYFVRTFNDICCVTKHRMNLLDSWTTISIFHCIPAALHHSICHTNIAVTASSAILHNNIHCSWHSDVHLCSNWNVRWIINESSRWIGHH